MGSRSPAGPAAPTSRVSLRIQFSLPVPASRHAALCPNTSERKRRQLVPLVLWGSAKGAYTYTTSLPTPNSRAGGVSHLQTGRQPADSRSGSRRPGARTSRPVATLWPPSCRTPGRTTGLLPDLGAGRPDPAPRGKDETER